MYVLDIECLMLNVNVNNRLEKTQQGPTHILSLRKGLNTVKLEL